MIPLMRSRDASVSHGDPNGGGHTGELPGPPHNGTNGTASVEKGRTPHAHPGRTKAPSMLNVRLITHGIACTALICLANVFLLLALLLKPFSERMVWGLACWTAEWFWGYMQHHFESTCDARPVIRVTGDELLKGESAVVISNHQTYADYYMVQHLAQKADMLGSCRYFAKKELVWKVPIFGWAFWAIGMILVSRNWTSDAAFIDEAFGRIRRGKHPIWVVLYPEGTRCTPRKVVQSQAFARQHGKVELEHLLTPRSKGFVATLQGLRHSQVQAVYDCTFLYTTPDGGTLRVPSMGELVSRSDLARLGYGFRIHVRRIPLEDIPKDEDGIREWLEGAWVRKDRLIAETRKRDGLGEDEKGRLPN